MSYPSKRKCEIKQEECPEFKETNVFGFCKEVIFKNGRSYCNNHLPCRCSYIWLIDSIWRYIEG